MLRFAIRSLFPFWILAASCSTQAATPGFYAWAPRPPMGWNSWDCFATTVNESLTHQEAEVMAEKLSAHGWEYIVVDIQWYEAGTSGFDYHPNAPLTMDEFGRLLPAASKFPSSVDGHGFKPLAEYIHGKGLKFGIHLMRGIPRQAAAQNLAIKGTSHRANEIADKVNVCPWNPDMYGVDMSKPGAQEYYNSVFELIASWGVDYIKVDDLSRPYIRNEPEIEAIRRAIDRTGRPMVLSLSPGETDIHAAAHVIEHANLWRISDDFWDHWSLLEAQFKRLDDWTPWRREGAWPDADMLPIGQIEMGRHTWFTPEEQTTLLTLWCIARSPLMLGADLTKLDGATLALISNDEVLAVNRASSNNRQLFRHSDGSIGWIADVPGSADKYLALFNTADPWVLNDEKRMWKSASIGRASAKQTVDFRVSATGLQTLVLRAEPNSSRFWWPAIWRNLRWEMGDGTERKIDRDYGSHGEKISGLPIPLGAVALKGTAQLDDAAREDKSDASSIFSIYGFTANDLKASGRPVAVSAADLGLSGRFAVRDLWRHRDLGPVEREFTTQIEWHNARLYRIHPLDK